MSTMLPAGAHFDSPAPLTLPNVDDLAPGTVTELYSFDHDLGAFVAIGTGTVSEDGLVLRSDAGFGVLEAGWQCGGQPQGGGASASLSVTLSPDPVKIEYGGTTTAMAAGKPPADGEYLNWKVLGSNVDNTIRFTGQPRCPGAATCANTLESQELPIGPNGHPPAQVCGTAQAEVTFRCTTTGKTATDRVSIEQGCGGKGASECRSLCSEQRSQGMCGTPCDLLGVTPPAYNRDSDACWRANVGVVVYCYWDHRAENGGGFEELCCPNKCFDESFTVWGQPAELGPYLCTVIQRCDTNPAFADDECARAR